jgi:DNA mismatch endonuclease (patch repair protein)
MGYKFKTTKERSRLMSKIRSTETSLEIVLRKALWNEGIRYRKNYKKISGNPDIAIVNKKIAIFVDGEFWHGYKWKDKKKKIKTNREYWIPKIERTILRDKINTRKLRKEGWVVIRFWEQQLKKDLTKCLKKIRKELN